MSTVQNIAHFGLGNNTKIDSIVVQWNINEKTVVKNIASTQNFKIRYDSATILHSVNGNLNTQTLFSNVTKSLNINHYGYEEDFIDFNIQKMLPHKLTQFGPSIACGDINGDGLDDVLIGGGSPFFTKAYIQNTNGTFSKTNAIDSVGLKYQDDASLCLLDADVDGDLDLFIASGGAENEPFSPYYNDNFYINDGKGKFTLMQDALPRNMFPKSAVKAADYDSDGDLDLFIGGRVQPGSYPQPVSSYIYKNETSNGVVKFTNVTNQVAPELVNIGLVTDALWTDVDNDNILELVVVGEYMPITIFKNEKGTLKKLKTNLDLQKGWFNSINGADLDNDGDIDYVVGNYGLNTFLKTNTTTPLVCLGGDFDKNQSYDAVLFHPFLSAINGKINMHPVFGRDDFLKELSIKRELFPTYSSYANATQTQIFTKEEIANATKANVTNFNTAWIENKGNMNFVYHNLPNLAQLSPTFGTQLQDINNDNYIDIILVGNDFMMHPFLGRSDAGNGLVLLNDGSGNFLPQTPSKSGFYVSGNAKSLASLIVKNKMVQLATQNNAPVEAFTSNINYQLKKINDTDKFAMITLHNGKIQKQEFYNGNGFQSQQSKFIAWQKNIKSIQITNHKNEKKLLN
jgi:enediyne biosynthesis protein E4